MTRWILISLSFTFTTFNVGCGNVAPSSHEDVRHFKAVGVMYGRYLSSHAGKPPASEKELREFVETKGASTLKRFGLTDSEALFVSPRDKQPLVWVFQGSDTNRVIAYEKQGLEGLRVVVTAFGTVEELSEEEFRSRVK